MGKPNYSVIHEHEPAMRRKEEKKEGGKREGGKKEVSTRGRVEQRLGR